VNGVQSLAGHDARGAVRRNHIVGKRSKQRLRKLISSCVATVGFHLWSKSGQPCGILLMLSSAHNGPSCLPSSSFTSTRLLHNTAAMKPWGAAADKTAINETGSVPVLGSSLSSAKSPPYSKLCLQGFCFGKTQGVFPKFPQTVRVLPCAATSRARRRMGRAFSSLVPVQDAWKYAAVSSCSDLWKIDSRQTRPAVREPHRQRCLRCCPASHYSAEGPFLSLRSVRASANLAS